MTTAVIDGRRIGSLQELYVELYRELNAPEFAGHNLTALADCLDGLIETPIRITWKNAALSKKKMGRDFEKVIALVRDIRDNRAASGLAADVLVLVLE